MKDKAAIFDEIKEVLEGNGTIPQAKRDRLVLAMLAGVYEGLYGEGGICDQIENAKAQINEIKPVFSLMKWAGGVIGVALLLLIWALITGQATLTIK